MIAGAAAAALILIFTIRRGRPMGTPYLDLWERALSSAGIWERVAQWFPGASAVFMICSVLFAGLAAARPIYRSEGAREWYYCIDRSASMATVEGGRSRLDAVKTNIRERLQKGNPRDRIGLLTIGDRLEIVARPGEDRAALAAAISNIEILPRRGDLEALSVLESENTPILLFTDGANRKLESLQKIRAKVRSLRVESAGAKADNTGIIHLEIDDPFPEKEITVKCTVARRAASSANVNIEILRGEVVVKAQSVEMLASSEAELSFTFDRGDGGLHRLRLTPGDAFPLDDEAAFLLETPARAPLVIVENGTPGDPFLEAAARALALDLQIPLGRAASAADAPADAVVLQSGGSIGGFCNKAILFGAAGDGIGERSASRGALSTILQINRRHPLLEGLLLESLIARPSLQLSPLAESLVIGTDGAEIGLVTSGGRRIVASSFTLDQCNLPLLQSEYPLFLRRAFVWCAAGEARVVPFVKTGFDEGAPWRGLSPDAGPPRLGPCVLNGRPSAASLLDPLLVDANARAVPFGDPMPAGPPVDKDLSPISGALAAAALFLALLFEGATIFRSFRAAPRTLLIGEGP